MKNRTALVLLTLLAFQVFGLSLAPAQESSETGRKVVNKVIPQYPGLARTMNISGTVRVEVLVAPNGSAKSLEIKGGHPILVEAAQNAVRQWKWEPVSHETHESVELRFHP
ncbi:MAG: energy transducer TonB [Candidatus Sulfotelmatobacter sp.]